MNQKEYQNVVNAFEKYYKTFDNPSYNMILKYQHSYNVADYMMELAKRLKLSRSDQYLAKTIGLLHDIGRFEQLREINSFSDNLFDHALYGIKYLFDENHIRDFIESNKNDLIIKEAILNHNKYKIDSKLKGRKLKFAYMIRDMDKVDIYYQVATKYVPKFYVEPSKRAMDALYNGESVYKDDVLNDSDKFIQMMAFINDIYYSESIDILRDSNNLNYYICSIDVKEDYKELFDKIVNYCLNKIEMGGLNEES